MPPHIQPKRLDATVLVNVKKLIIDSCVNIESRFASFDHHLCKQAVSELQNYLLPKVQPFLNCVCDDASYDDLRELDDKRIFYSVVVHRKTKVLNLNSLVNSFAADFIWLQTFSIDLISKLDHLVSLHISQRNSTKQVLKAIAATSYMSLEELTITPMLTEFSDGLECLSICQELRYLKILSFQENYPIENCLERLRLLIQSLPKLEFFDNGDMIKILAGVEVTNPLPLTKLREVDTNVEELSYVINMCPKLTDIDIAVVSPYLNERKSILNNIAGSSLPLKSLTFRGFECLNEVDHVLSIKGACLTNVTIAYPFNVVKCVNVYVIGKYCPNLRTLDLDFHDLGFDYEALPNNTEGGVVTPLMFTKLESLCFGWYKVMPNGQSVLPLILRDANQISILKLQCCTALSNHDALSDLLCSNRLVMLTDLSLIVNGPGAMSQQSMSCLIDRCQGLRECYMYGHIRREAQVYLQKLYGRIQDENLDLKFDVFGR